MGVITLSSVMAAGIVECTLVCCLLYSMEGSYWSRTTTQENLPPALAFLAEPVRYPNTFIQQWCQYRPPNAYISDVAAVNSKIELLTRLFCSDESGAQREATTLAQNNLIQGSTTVRFCENV